MKQHHARVLRIIIIRIGLSILRAVGLVYDCHNLYAVMIVELVDFIDLRPKHGQSEATDVSCAPPIGGLAGRITRTLIPCLAGHDNSYL